MDYTEATNQLRSMCAADSHPVLDEAAIAQCLTRARRADAAGNPATNVDTAGGWTASTQYLAGTVIKVGSRWWRAERTATTGTTTPTWPDLDQWERSSSEVYDGDMEWSDNGAKWSPTWSLRMAAADAWQIKAGLAAGDYDFGADGQQFSRSQVVDSCLKMARKYAGGTSRTLELPLC